MDLDFGPIGGDDPGDRAQGDRAVPFYLRAGFKERNTRLEWRPPRASGDATSTATVRRWRQLVSPATLNERRRSMASTVKPTVKTPDITIATGSDTLPSSNVVGAIVSASVIT
jgi:hypothetical protein